ncbi:MAG: tRNA(Ile2) 2-agmatinylcytidine synthetase TiaS [Methanomassiliicoccales archaeon PtaU1.Bin124]|nr:MAG: tRNA(Ile2) 2-agmatinylcytidine synthetase TiaS [Methanomassiliicoccales archaeon PtaU1.Bin124]
MATILKPDDVQQKYGKLFCRGVYTMVDEKNGVAQIIEECSAKGPVEWDAVNRTRAKGVLQDIKVEGTTLIMNARIGEEEVRFGPASKDLGGQGLKALRVDGDTVRTTWVGLAGASVGIGACLPQGPGTIEAIYPDDAKVGGAHRIEVTIVTPKLVRVILAVDDTDTKEKGASWALMLRIARACDIGHMLEHKIVQLNPNVPEKTTNCVSVGVSFAVAEKDVQRLIDFFVERLRKETFSQQTTLAVFIGLKVPKEVAEYGLQAKSVIFKKEQAKEVADRNGVRLIEVTGSRGTIGAVAGIGCFDMGLKAAGLPEDF